ncbi:MAG: hypothetical protein ACRDZ8_05510 [Acidimicrobiales bacterium]
MNPLIPPTANAGATGGPPSQPAPKQEAPIEVARAFVDAVAWGEHLEVWKLFSEEARHLVLRVAATRGMDDRLAGRLRDGTATVPERDAFLGDLVNGLRTDLRGCDLDTLIYEVDPDAEGSDPNRTSVMLLTSTINPQLGPPLPVASMELVREGSRWCVERLQPRVKRS